MNRFLVASAIVGSTMGVIHGHSIRNKQQSLFEDIGHGVRDAAYGAIAFPFIIPIGLYQIATNTNSCVFKSLIKKSSPSSETEKNDILLPPTR